MTETEVAVIVDRMIGKAVHGGGQEHMQIGDAEGEMILHVQRLQAVETQRGIFRRIRGAEDRIFRLKGAEGAGVLRDDIGGNDGDLAGGVFTDFIIAVGR